MDINDKANKLVDLFKSELSDKAMESLTTNDFNKLTGLFVSAISEERLANAKSVDALAEKMKEGAKQADINL
ncbi:MAG: hypothetical protein R3240_02915 [Gammaproteobacteria bacterium]|nr:hypothetical protein [Gammaproteobacteria bacterium]